MADTIDDKLTQLLTGVTALTTRIDAVEKERGETKADAESVGKMLKDCAATMDSINKRLDSLEQHRKDSDEALKAEREKNDLKKNDAESEEDKKKREAKERDDAERVRKDAEEAAKKEKEEREDAARKDAQARHDAQESRIKGLEAQLSAVTQHMKDAGTEDRAKLAAIWSQDEKLCQLFGDSAKGAGPDKWWPGESVASYSRRVASKYKQHSAKWKDIDLTNVTDDATFANVASEIYNDAQAAAMRGAGAPAGSLQRVEIVDPYSHARRIEWRGDDEGATWRAFANPLKIGKFSTPSKS